MKKTAYTLSAVCASPGRCTDVMGFGGVRAVERQCGVFESRPVAEEALAALAADEYFSEIAACWFIRRMALYAKKSDFAFEKNDEWMSPVLGTWSYRADGSLNCASRLDFNCSIPFRGRPVSDLQARCGDLCAFYDEPRSLFVLGVVEREPCAPEKISLDRQNGRGDWTDDCFRVAMPKGGLWVFAPYVFSSKAEIEKMTGTGKGRRNG